MKKGLPLLPRVQQGVKVYTYSANEKADFYADNIHYGNGELRFDFATPDTLITDINLGVPVTVNIENGVAAMAMAWLNGATATEIRDAMATFAGTNRRFNFILKTDKLVMMDDYAHHPEELKACITSVRNLYPDKRILGIFQPHLFSRTRDFYKEFAKSLSMLNGVILLPIYPAREKPIPGITSEIILDEVTADDKRICSKERLCEEILHTDYDVYITIGAGDIELLIPEIKETLSNKA
jgi:UDP-N-acetylmuramate--alanine ligase